MLYLFELLSARDWIAPQGIGQRMLDVRGAGAYLTGPSTANQVRGSFKSQLAQCCVLTWISLQPSFGVAACPNEL